VVGVADFSWIFDDTGPGLATLKAYLGTIENFHVDSLWRDEDSRDVLSPSRRNEVHPPRSLFPTEFLANNRTMKLSFAILSLAATASAFIPSAPARSVARVGGSSVLAPVPVRAAGT
jgi:hypothetical protein